MEIAWSEHLSVGNSLIDSDHKKMIVSVSDMAHAIGSRNHDALAIKFKLFDDYMCIHLRNEERIAEAVKYSFAQNKLEHQQLMNEMRYMINKLEGIQGDWPEHMVKMYSRFLEDWLTDHIVKKDMQMKSVLQFYPYDFNPG